MPLRGGNRSATRSGLAYTAAFSAQIATMAGQWCCTGRISLLLLQQSDWVLQETVTTPSLLTQPEPCCAGSAEQGLVHHATVSVPDTPASVGGFTSDSNQPTDRSQTQQPAISCNRQTRYSAKCLGTDSGLQKNSHKCFWWFDKCKLATLPGHASLSTS